MQKPLTRTGPRAYAFVAPHLADQVALEYGLAGGTAGVFIPGRSWHAIGRASRYFLRAWSAMRSSLSAGRGLGVWPPFLVLTGIRIFSATYRFCEVGSFFARGAQPRLLRLDAAPLDLAPHDLHRGPHLVSPRCREPAAPRPKNLFDPTGRTPNCARHGSLPSVFSPCSLSGDGVTSLNCVGAASGDEGIWQKP